MAPRVQSKTSSFLIPVLWCDVSGLSSVWHHLVGGVSLSVERSSQDTGREALAVHMGCVKKGTARPNCACNKVGVLTNYKSPSCTYFRIFSAVIVKLG